MPNHVINRLEFECPEERLKEILSAICYDDSTETEKEHLETAASIWGHTLEDYGLTLDTSGNLETKEAINIE